MLKPSCTFEARNEWKPNVKERERERGKLLVIKDSSLFICLSLSQLIWKRVRRNSNEILSLLSFFWFINAYLASDRINRFQVLYGFHTTNSFALFHRHFNTQHALVHHPDISYNVINACRLALVLAAIPKASDLYRILYIYNFNNIACPTDMKIEKQILHPYEINI